MHVIIDLDGTVADNNHRRHYVTNGQRDWDNFERVDLVLKDTVIPGVPRVLEKFQSLKYELIFLTGRRENLRDVTMRWLYEKLGINANDDNLLMRPPGNMLKAAEYKREQIMAVKRERAIHGRGFLILDDDPRVHEMYGEHGLTLKAPECWAVMFPETPKD